MYSQRTKENLTENKSKLLRITRAQFVNLLIFYLIAHGGILFILNSMYWDSWTNFNMIPEFILKTSGDIGNPFSVTSHINICFLIIYSYDVLF